MASSSPHIRIGAMKFQRQEIGDRWSREATLVELSTGSRQRSVCAMK
jgi:hypothetical protein